MDLFDLLKSAGGDDSMGQMANSLGLDASDLGKVVSALAPALMGSIMKEAESGDGFKSALRNGNHERYLNDPSTMRDPATRLDGNAILGHLLGSKDASRRVATAAEQETGISSDLIKKALPLIAAMAMGAMSKKTSQGNDDALGSLIKMASKFF